MEYSELSDTKERIAFLHVQNLATAAGKNRLHTLHLVNTF